jgi:hypothetical protein
VLRSRIGYTSVIFTWILVALWADGHLDRWAQSVVSVATWILLAAVFATAAAGERRQIVVVVVVATCFEIAFSIVWGLYRYRYGNLPMYVPPGHGLVYLLAVRLSGFGWLRADRVRTAGLVTLAVSGWVAVAVLLGDPRDIVGLCLLPALLFCLWRAGRWNVYAGAFIATTVLELVGTRFGNWHWAESVPGLGIPQGNPPAAIAAGYCLLDAIVLYLCTRQPLRSMARWRSSSTPSTSFGPNHPGAHTHSAPPATSNLASVWSIRAVMALGVKTARTARSDASSSTNSR